MTPRTGRRAFLAGGIGVVSALALQNVAAAENSEFACCPTRVATPAFVPDSSAASATAGNRDAMALARKSSRIMEANEAALATADAIADPLIKSKTLDLLRNPAPTYQLKSRTKADKEAVRQELQAAGLIGDTVTVDGIFPPVNDPSEPPQAFWSAPGSTYAGHHSYPGGLVVHSWTNASLAQQFLDAYDARYGLVSESGAINASYAQAAPLWHDNQKVAVFQWNSDGSEFIEQPIADTGGHHPLSGAEAIVRGMPADFVVALLGAHDPPQSGVSYNRLVNYVRAAAIIAHVDPVAMGMLRQTADGWALAQDPPRIEPHINHLSDHDFVFSGDSAAILIQTLKDLAPQYGIDPPSQAPRFNLFRNLVFSQLTDMRLYGVLQVGGADAVKSAIDQSVDLSALRTP
jgi:hypothetical protein